MRRDKKVLNKLAEKVAGLLQEIENEEELAGLLQELELEEE